MKLFRLSILFSFVVSLAQAALAVDGAAWLRSRLSNALNPKISVIGDFVFQSGPGRSNQFSLRETEVTFQSEIDPTTRADFFIAIPDGEGFELEEGYITLLALPLGLQARGGKFLANFGRLNIVHDHELPQVTRPLVLETYLGEEGFNDSGVEVARIFTPFNIFTEVTYSFLNGLGEEEEEEATTTTVADVDGNEVTVALAGEEEEESKRNLRDFAHSARVRFYKDITDSANVELGASGLLFQPRRAKQTKMGQADLTVRWRPLKEGGSKSVVWRTSVLLSKRDLLEETDAITGATVSPKQSVERAGGYSYLEVQVLRALSFGTRGDYVENPEGRGNVEVTRAVSPYVTFYANEFNRYRAQYEFRDIPGTQDEHRFFLQWTVIMGPHGAHAY